MRASDFLNETELNELVRPTAGSDRSITINIPANLFATQGPEAVAEEQEEETAEDVEVQQEPSGQEEIEVDPESQEADELDDIVRLAGGKDRQNHTIAQPASNVVPDKPVFVSPLQQQLELQKQQGGKASPIINQILQHSDETTGSLAGEHPEQSVYHDSPLKDNEWVGAGTGEVDNLANKTTTQGATKPWYKL